MFLFSGSSILNKIKKNHQHTSLFDKNTSEAGVFYTN